MCTMADAEEAIAAGKDLQEYSFEHGADRYSMMQISALLNKPDVMQRLLLLGTININ